jgi:hypothetical protein
MSDIENQASSATSSTDVGAGGEAVAEVGPNLSSSTSGPAGGAASGRKRRASSLSTSAPAAALLQSSGERRVSRRERLSGRGFMPPASGGGFDEDLDDEEADVATSDVLLYLARRIACEFGANLAFNLPLRLVSLRQAARPLGLPQHSLVQEVKSLLTPHASSSSSSSLSALPYVLGTSAFIGMSEVTAGLFSGLVSMYFDSGHIPTVDEWHEHEKPTFYGISRKQLAVFGGKLLTGVFFYPFFAVAPILLATRSWPGTRQFFGDLVHNRNGFWSALALNVAKYSIIDLAPFLENKLYQYLQLDPEEDEQVEDEWEKEHSVFSAKHLIKYGLSLTSTALACLLYVPLDVLTTQMIVYPNQYSGVLDCTKKVLAAEGLKGLYRGFWANLLSEQELLFI